MGAYYHWRTLRLGGFALATLLLLALAGWFMPWFSAEGPRTVQLFGDPTAQPVDTADGPSGTARIKLLEVEICHETTTYECGTAMTYEIVDGVFPKIAAGVFGAGLIFGLLVINAERRRVIYGEARWGDCVAAFVAGGATLVLGVVLLFVERPGAIAYEIVDRHRFDYHTNASGFTAAPSLGNGPWVLLMALLLGAYAVWRARPLAEDAADEPEVTAAPPPREERRVPIEPPPRGVETDPFRAPPAPPPIAVVRPHRESTAPVIAPRAASQDDAPGPKLLT